MQRRYIPIICVVSLMMVTAAAGYWHSSQRQRCPARLVLDNTGGRVIFTHQGHVDTYGFDCADCHHDDLEADRPFACGVCHPPAFDARFRQNHQKAFPDKQACQRCHDDIPEGTKLAEGNRPDVDSIPIRVEAFHGQCQSCHEENGGPCGADACRECHAE